MKLNNLVDEKGIPNPGSNAALNLGCTCPVLDNEHGVGAYLDLNGKPLFWIDPECPLHGTGMHDNPR